MAKLLRRFFRHAKRRIKKGLRDQRTLYLHEAACRLLATHDHEQVSVARLAHEAGISVGAFYQRFANKDAFLGRVVSTRMASAQTRMERELDPGRWHRTSVDTVTQAIVTQMMRDLHGPGAGVVRTALKRGHLDRHKLEPLQRYREALADRAVALLAHRAQGVRHPERAVRATMQIAQAMALDALLYDAGPLKPGSWRMADALSAMMLSGLGFADERPTKAADAAEPIDDDAMLEMPIEDVIVLPLTEPAAPPRSPRRRAARDAEPKPAQATRVKPPVPAAAEKPEPPVRRKPQRKWL